MANVVVGLQHNVAMAADVFGLDRTDSLDYFLLDLGGLVGKRDPIIGRVRSARRVSRYKKGDVIQPGGPAGLIVNDWQGAACDRGMILITYRCFEWRSQNLVKKI